MCVHCKQLTPETCSFCKGLPPVEERNSAAARKSYRKRKKPTNQFCGKEVQGVEAASLYGHGNVSVGQRLSVGFSMMDDWSDNNT